jgi:hypothetical protein
VPSLYVIAGPNGAGKTTFVKRFAPRHLALLDFESMKTFPLANGIPMHLLSELGLHESFLDCVEQHRRDDLPMALNRSGRSELVPVSALEPEIARARNRIAELTTEIAKYERSQFSVNEAPPE